MDLLSSSRKEKIFADSRDEFRALLSDGQRKALIARKKAECIELYGPFEGGKEAKVNTYYSNQKYQQKTRSKDPKPSTSQALSDKSSITAWDVYWEANIHKGSELNQRVNEERTKNGVLHTQHLKLINEAVSKTWGELTPEEKDIWEKKAENLNTQAAEKMSRHPEYVTQSHFQMLVVPDHNLSTVANQEIDALFEKFRKNFGLVYFEVYCAIPGPQGEPLALHRLNAPLKFDKMEKTQVGERFLNHFTEYAKEIFIDAGLKKSTSLEWSLEAEDLTRLELIDYLEKHLTAHYCTYFDSTFDGDSLPFEDFQKNPEQYLIDPQNLKFIKDPNQMTVDELPAVKSFFATTPVFFKKDTTLPLAMESALESITEDSAGLPTPTPTASSEHSTVLPTPTPTTSSEHPVVAPTPTPTTSLEHPVAAPTPTPAAGSEHTAAVPAPTHATSSTPPKLSTPAKVRRVLNKDEEKPAENQQSPHGPGPQSAPKAQRGEKQKSQEVATSGPSKKSKKKVASTSKAQKDVGEGPSRNLDDPKLQSAPKPRGSKKHESQEAVASGPPTKKSKKEVALTSKAQEDVGEGLSKKPKQATKTSPQVEQPVECCSARERHQVDRSKPLEILSEKTGTQPKVKPSWEIVVGPRTPPKARLPIKPLWKSIEAGLKVGLGLNRLSRMDAFATSQELRSKDKDGPRVSLWNNPRLILAGMALPQLGRWPNWTPRLDGHLLLVAGYASMVFQTKAGVQVFQGGVGVRWVVRLTSVKNQEPMRGIVSAIFCIMESWWEDGNDDGGGGGDVYWIWDGCGTQRLKRPVWYDHDLYWPEMVAGFRPVDDCGIRYVWLNRESGERGGVGDETSSLCGGPVTRMTSTRTQRLKVSQLKIVGRRYICACKRARMHKDRNIGTDVDYVMGNLENNMGDSDDKMDVDASDTMACLLEVVVGATSLGKVRGSKVKPVWKYLAQAVVLLRNLFFLFRDPPTSPSPASLRR
ncbi:hypothetical protein BDP27DRAFT_1366835 [Rhodocollybia butyracea]|uniref:Uncharacterized protein n=1 Tax=Rhodocollybia butyracea TaxID=206335 RepID=A0A9P5PGJ0_9AGAR|nr:hypothetical protein BDP27DRAFT_1366835 [Rhodocollybia butyracea]